MNLRKPHSIINCTGIRSRCQRSGISTSDQYDNLKSHLIEFFVQFADKACPYVQFGFLSCPIDC